MKSRSAWVLVHRYAGLFMALFLAVAGITGSILAFYPQIDQLLHPPPRVVVRASGMLDPLELRRRAEASVPGSMANHLPLDMKPGEAVRFRLTAHSDPATGMPRILPADSVWLDPYTGTVVDRGRTNSDLWPVNRDNFLSVIVGLHYSLLLPGSWGTWLFGIAALLWTFDCFVSAYLTFPLRIRRDSAARGADSWWSRWSQAWRIKWRGSFYRVNFDLHRAGGLWPWALLLVLAWTSVGFNLHEQVYAPVMRIAFTYHDPFQGRAPAAHPTESPALGWREALQLGRTYMRNAADMKHFSVRTEQYMYYLPEYAVYMYVVHSDRDVNSEGGSTFVMLNARDGRSEGLGIPTGDASGNTVDSWLFALHVASIGGLAYRTILAILGIAIAVLSVTGIYIWWKKRAARRWSMRRRNAKTLLFRP